MRGTRQSRSPRGSKRALILIVIGFVFAVLAAASLAATATAGQASETQAGPVAPGAHFQATDDGPRRFTGALLLTTRELAAAEPFVTINSVELTLPPEGEAGSVDGQFALVLEIPGPVMYVNIVGLAEEIGAAIGESVSAVTGVTADQVERSGIDVPPEFEDCIFASTISGGLASASADTLGGTGNVATVITGPGCEDTDAAVPSGGQVTDAPSSWSATLAGDRITGTIAILDEDGDASELEFEATLAGAPGGTLACPSVAGYEEGIGSGNILEAGSGDYQRAFVCRYLSEADGGGSFQISARWDWAEPPAGAGPTSCGLPPLEDTLGSGNIYGYSYSQDLAALVSWSETASTGISHSEFAQLVAPLLPAAEALAVPCPSVDGGGAAPGAVVPTTGGGDGDGSAITRGGDEGGAFTDFVLGEEGFEVTREEAAVAAAAATGVVALTTLILVLTNAAGTAGAGAGTAGDAVADIFVETRDDAPPPDTIETQGPPPDVGDVDPGVMDPAVMDPATRDLDADVPRVTPLDPGLPPVDAELTGAAAGAMGADGGAAAPIAEAGAPPVPAPPPMSQEMIDRWATLGADGQGRVFDRYGQHIATIDRAGGTVDLNGNPIASMTPDFGINGFTDDNGRVIEYSESGVPVQRTETDSGPIFTPVTDLPAAGELRPDLTPAAQARWTGAGAGPDGELYGVDGSVIGRIDTDGVMRTLDGREITAYGEPDGGRLSDITVDGERMLTPGATPRTDAATGDVASRGDAELADLVQRTEVAQAERAAAQAAGTDVSGPEASGDTQATGPEGTAAGGDTRATGPDVPADGDTRASGPDGAAADGDTRATGPDAAAGGDTRITAPDTPGAAAPSADGAAGDVRAPDGEAPRVAGDASETRVAAEGPRFGAGLGAAMDAQGLIQTVQGDIAAGQDAGTAITRAVASTWAGNTIGELGTGVTDVRMTLLGASVLPNGVNNLLPDQFAANTVATGLDAWGAVVGDAATALGEGQVSTDELDRFAQGLVDRPGADPWAGYARLGDAVGEELGNADMDPATMFGNLADDLARMDEQDVFVEQALEAASGFEQEAYEGQHGTVLRGLSEATRVATNPPDPDQFVEDSATLARVLWDDVTGGGDTGGMGPGFWEEQAQHANAQIRGVPVVGTVFDGYAQMASGLEEQGVAGFSTEMYEGGAALAEEGVMLASETADQATDVVADYAVATVDAIAGWF